jgi:hypothetical protein
MPHDDDFDGDGPADRPANGLDLRASAVALWIVAMFVLAAAVGLWHLNPF